MLIFHLLLGHLARDYILTGLLLPILVLTRLLFLNRLQAHPLFVAARLTFIDHLLFYFFSSINLTHVGNLLRLFNLLLKEPRVHGFRSILILVPLNFGHIEQFFFDLVLSLPDKLAFKAFLCLFTL